MTSTSRAAGTSAHFSANFYPIFLAFWRHLRLILAKIRSELQGSRNLTSRVCNLTFTLKDDMDAPVFVHYGLNGNTLPVERIIFRSFHSCLINSPC
jgi:hypothetical protein